jgi:hypothetical protein
VNKKIKTSPSGLENEEKKVSKKDDGLNCIGYPHDDPYGLIAAFKKTFGFNIKKEKSKVTTEIHPFYSAKDFYT